MPGCKRGIQTEQSAEATGGYFVLCRVDGVMAYWGGSSWVYELRQAERYQGAPSSDFTRAEADEDRLNGEGAPCVILYVPVSPPRLRSRVRPRPGVSSSAVGV